MGDVTQDMVDGDDARAMQDLMLLSDCARCYYPLNGRVIHDEGQAWHDHGRRALIAEQAAARADRLIATDIDTARALAGIQRGHLQEVA